MKFLRYCLVLLLLDIVVADVGCQGLGQDCGSFVECCDTANFCWGTSGNDKVCNRQTANKGDICSSDQDCTGSLVCEHMDDRGFRCSECRKGEHFQYGVPNDREYREDDPTDSKCTELGVTCSCDYLTNSGDHRLYGRWTSRDDFCDVCSSSQECFSLECRRVQGKSRQKCLNPGADCCTNNDCGSGLYCSGNVCVELPAVTVTSTSTSTTTTTTLPFELTTTTTLLDAFECDIMSSISSGLDDGYEVEDTQLWVFDVDLLAHSSTGLNNTLALTFRNVSLGYNVESLNARLYLRTQDIPDPVTEWIERYYRVIGINLPALSSTNKPSTMTTDNSLHTSNHFCDGDVCYWTFTTTILGESDTHTGFGNDEWYPFDVSKQVQTILTFDNPNLWRYGDNITILHHSKIHNELNDVSYFSYDDDSTKAPKLCLYNITYFDPDEINFCDSDDDCIRWDFCESGWLPVARCMAMKDDYTLSEDSDCFRNHECLSGVCSSHELNAPFDYPDFSVDRNPYSEVGQCLLVPSSLEVKTSPSIIGLGEDFEVFVSTLRDGKPYYPQRCKAYFDNYFYNSSFLESNSTWGYSSEEGADVGVGHSLVSTGNAYWTFKNEYVLSTNVGVGEGVYRLAVECLNADNLVQLKQSSVVLKYTNRTNIEFIEKPGLTIQRGTEGVFRLKFLDYMDAPISGASCIMRFQENNQSFVEGGFQDNPFYSVTPFFNETGNKDVEIWCNSSTKDGIYLIGGYVVQPNHCENNILDSNEGGVDCGGDCIPCEVDDKKPAFDDCSDDSECFSGFCDVDSRLCLEPTCFDGFLNNGEVQTDCGGVFCPPCPMCLYDSDCSFDGSQLCNQDTFSCDRHTCSDDGDCGTLRWGNAMTQSVDYRQTYCDPTDGLCKFDFEVEENQTDKSLSLVISPLSGVSVNKSGTIFYVFNCDDGENGFRLKTNSKTSIRYSFASSDFHPSIESSNIPLVFGEDGTTEKTSLIPELCISNDDIVGGISADRESAFSKINFKVCTGELCKNQYVDVKTFRDSMRNSVGVFAEDASPGTVNYVINVTNRTMQVWVRLTPEHEWKNITSGYVQSVIFNQSSIRDELQITGAFQVLVNSSFGEMYLKKVSDFIPWIVEWDQQTNWFKLGDWIKLEGWMLYPFLALILVYVAWLNYKTKRREGGV